MAARHRGAAHPRAAVARHRRTSPLVAACVAHGRMACAAGVIVLGAAFGLTAAAPEEEPAVERPADTLAGPLLPGRQGWPVTSRGEARSVPASVDAATPLAEPPEASPSPSPSPTPETTETASPPPADAPEDCDAYSGNRLIACAMLADYGFGVDQMPALDQLWTHESGWNERAQNPSSGAYGIPQALPGEKMASCGDDWRTNPATQICWGLGYIRDRYGTPDAAWAHFQAQGWY